MGVDKNSQTNESQREKKRKKRKHTGEILRLHSKSNITGSVDATHVGLSIKIMSGHMRFFRRSSASVIRYIRESHSATYIHHQPPCHSPQPPQPRTAIPTHRSEMPFAVMTTNNHLLHKFVWIIPAVRKDRWEGERYEETRE